MASIVIPALGIAMEEALLVRWLKQPGDLVATDEPVAEIETDKATVELVSPVKGQLGPHLVDEGLTVPVGAAIVEVLVEGEDTSGERGIAPVQQREEVPAGAAAMSDRASASGHPGLDTAAVSQSEAAADTEARATRSQDRRPHTLSPRARRLADARRRGIAAAPTDQRADRFRELIAAKVSDSWREIPHFAVSREVDAESMVGALAALRATHVEPSPTLTDLLLRALAIALRDVGHGDTIDVGLAVATPYGVVIPVVRDVLGEDMGALAAKRSGAAERARAGRLNPDDMAASPHSTLSNLGANGVDQFTGIIASGQTSLLTVGRALPRVVATDARTVQIRTTFHATLNVDHRTIDGADAARLLVAFALASESMS
jgi:pyruvate/2-oxoglutarate dehydrogenase complex dihydrolipoamide acyltransferase (E2) component